MDETKKKANNPNLDAKQLVEPMLFEKEDGTPLLEPMIFYDRPLDFNHSLPLMKQSDLEYKINWKAIEKELGEPIFPLDFIKKFHSETKEITKNTPTKIQAKVEAFRPNDEHQNVADEYSAYSIMNRFLSMVKLKISNENFYVYSGVSYVPKSHKEIARLIVEKCRPYIKTKSSSFIDGIVNFIQREPLVVITEDIPKNYVAFQNGILDIKNRMFLKHSPEFLTLYEITANYCPTLNISTPIFDNYLFSITNGDADLMERILQMFGYCLTPDNSAKCFFLLQGVPNSGKSVLSNVLQKLFSFNAVTQLEAQLFGEKFTASELIGKALCSLPDIPSVPLDFAAVSRIKSYTGNDPITAPVKFKENEKFICSAKFIFATNHPFLTKKKDEGFDNRIVTIPFRYSVSKENQIYDLEKMLLKERDGIVTKSIAAYFRLVDNNYKFAGEFKPNEVIANLEAKDMDYTLQIYEFTKNKFIANENGIVFIEDAFNLFCEIFNGISKNDFSHFFQRYANQIFTAKKDRKRKAGFGNPLSCLTGISFKEDGYGL